MKVQERKNYGVKPGGHRLKDVMRWKYFGQMPDEELKAVWLYLQLLPALEQGKSRVD